MTAATKSEPAKALDLLQTKVRPNLKELGFRFRGRTLNRQTADGLTQVLQFQMGVFDPPGTHHIPWIRENLYGKFTVNVGVYVPEIAQADGIGAAASFVQEASCCIRARLGKLGPEHRDMWWDLSRADETAPEIWGRLRRDALPFLGRFESRDAILTEWRNLAKSPYSNRPRVDCAIILAGRGQRADAMALLTTQAREAGEPRHVEYLRGLSRKLGLGELDV
jgi:hypothetical protein